MAMKELALYVAEQLSPLEEIRYIPMMGGWLFYYKDKIIGAIFDEGFAVKDTPASQKALSGGPTEHWENTPKSYLPCTILEDSEALCKMVLEMYPELPEPRKKPAKRRKKSNGI